MQTPTFEFSRELHDNVPATGGRGPSKGDGERVVDACRLQIRWPNGDLLTRAYVTSRRVIRIRVDANRREFRTFGGFDPPLLHFAAG